MQPIKLAFSKLLKDLVDGFKVEGDLNDVAELHYEGLQLKTMGNSVKIPAIPSDAKTFWQKDLYR